MLVLGRIMFESEPLAMKHGVTGHDAGLSNRWVVK